MEQKLYVIINKKGKYPDDTQFQPFFTTENIYKTTFYKSFEYAKNQLEICFMK